MAVETRRGCGYRKVGGTYMMGGEFMEACDRLPFKLDVCPCCGEGYRPSRGLRKINPFRMLGGVHEDCKCDFSCRVCIPPSVEIHGDDAKAGHYLEWIGGSFYKSPEVFMNEAVELGISRRLSSIPRELIIGKSVIYLAHRDVKFIKRNEGKRRRGKNSNGWFDFFPAIFSAFTVTRLEHICTESEMKLVGRWDSGEIQAIIDATDKSESELKSDLVFTPGLIKRIKSLAKMQEKGIKLIPVPDDDKDHR